MANKYWEDETPQTVVTDKNVIEYYPKAQKLSVGRPRWTDDTGNERQGKTVALDVQSVLDCGGEDLLVMQRILGDITEKVDACLG